jgi:Casein kinase II regulatory subunit
VPSGRSDLPGLDTVKLYCPNCHDIYAPPSSRFQGVDGEQHYRVSSLFKQGLDMDFELEQVHFSGRRSHTCFSRAIGS